MRNVRLIPRLDIKQGALIKGVQMEGWRKVGDPAEASRKYYEQGADELLFMDVVASLYERNSLHDVVRRVAAHAFVPLTVGGGIRSIEDVRELLANGADKVSVNTAVTRNPQLISQISDEFGSQATVVTIEAIKQSENQWVAMTDNGRNHTGLDVVSWAKQAEELGAGEIVLSSIDRDGLGSGFDIDLVKKVAALVSIPVIAAGGCGKPSDLGNLIQKTEVSGAAIAQAFHFNKVSFKDLRRELETNGCFTREVELGEWRNENA